MSTTTDQDLLRNCRLVADELNSPDTWRKNQVERYGEDYDPDEHDGAAAWLDEAYDIRYIIDRDKQFLSAEVLVAGGGPTIWVNFDNYFVEGYWGGDEVKVAFNDNLEVEALLQEMWEGLA